MIQLQLFGVKFVLGEGVGTGGGQHGAGQDAGKVLPVAANRLARSTDPVTSHQAASNVSKTGSAARWQQVALDLIRRRPGMTARELESAGGYENGQIRKRLLEVMRGGLIHKGTARTCRVSGRQAATWWASNVR
jgi:hypothetical protein